MGESTSKEVQRLSVRINDETAAVLTVMRERHGITITEAIRRSVSVYAFFKNADREGKKVRLVRPDRSGSEVTFL